MQISAGPQGLHNLCSAPAFTGETVESGLEE